MASIRLQGIGQFPAKPAADLQVGDTTVWAYGIKSKVKAVQSRGKSVYVVFQDADGKEWPARRFLGTRLVACSS